MTTIILRCNECREPADMLVGGRCLHCEPKKVAYTVRGSWPFPVDMLRYDQAVAATPEDKDAIDRMSGVHADSREDFKPRDVHLLALRKPNTARWESFGWSVPSDSEHAIYKAHREKRAADDARFAKVMSAVTEHDRRFVTDYIRQGWPA